MKGRIQWRRWGGMASLLMLLLICCGCAGFFRPSGSGQSVMTKEESSEDKNLPEERSSENGEAEERTEENKDTQENTIYVHVCGCVKNPGLYTFPAGVRAGSAVERAGGFTKKADSSAVNLAAVLEDGMQLYVPSARESTSAGESDESGEANVPGQGKPSAEELVNINTAGIEELMTLSGIGESRAEAILAYREENGLFSAAEDIKNVSGIGEGIFERIKNRITV